MGRLTKDELFKLYGRVQQKDRLAEDELRELHRAKYPNSPLYEETEAGKSSQRRSLLHSMYLHLMRGLK